MEVTENCGVLDKLRPGEMVLAGRGFHITDSAGSTCAAAEVQEAPPSTGQRCQLRAVNVEHVPNAYWVRCHVRRVIKHLRKKYTFLNDTMPAHMVLPLEGHDLSFLDVIVHVCCALTNFCPGIVVKL